MKQWQSKAQFRVMNRRYQFLHVHLIHNVKYLALYRFIKHETETKMLDCYHKCMSYLPKDKKIVARRIYCVKTVIISNDKNLTTGENGYTVTGVSNCYRVCSFLWWKQKANWRRRDWTTLNRGNYRSLIIIKLSKMAPPHYSLSLQILNQWHVPNNLACKIKSV